MGRWNTNAAINGLLNSLFHKMIISIAAIWIFFQLCSLALAASDEETRPRLPLERCKPVPGMNKQLCERLVNDGCSELLAWVGLGCVDSRGKRLRDGGCQSLADGAYCKWKCKKRCLKTDKCIWTNGECKLRGCGGVDILDFSPPDNPKSIQGMVSLRPLNWAYDGIAVPAIFSQITMCGLQLYAVSSRVPDVDQLEVLELRVYDGPPKSFTDTPLVVHQLNLAKSLGRGRLADSAFHWYLLRYELSQHSQLPFSGKQVYIMIRFPEWKDYAFSLLTSSVNSDDVLTCPVSIGNTTEVPVNSCRQNAKQKLYVKFFA